ncbi:MAG: 30S ribosomal protein S8 [Candidatus Sungbacteria bacterium]|nr:30S ribosomal protein S8 [Candidatus Sungbacteria bacterium]
MDPISDMFIRIKNAQKAGHETASVPYSKFKFELIKVLERSGYINSAERRGKRIKRFIEVGLKYHNGSPAVSGIRLLSRPSRRVYASAKELLGIARHGGVVAVSTSKGVMSHKDALKGKVGGQLIAEIW